MPFVLSIVTPQGEAYRGRVGTVVLPGSEGDFGVLQGHERFLAPLRIGQLEIRAEQGPLHAAVSGGFADVAAHEVVVLADACELAHQIDVRRAERARTEAEQEIERLRVTGADEPELRLWEAALDRALTRLQIAQRAGT